MAFCWQVEVHEEGFLVWSNSTTPSNNAVSEWQLLHRYVVVVRSRQIEGCFFSKYSSRFVRQTRLATTRVRDRPAEAATPVYLRPCLGPGRHSPGITSKLRSRTPAKSISPFCVQNYHNLVSGMRSLLKIKQNGKRIHSEIQLDLEFDAGILCTFQRCTACSAPRHGAALQQLSSSTASNRCNLALREKKRCHLAQLFTLNVFVCFCTNV